MAKTVFHFGRRGADLFGTLHAPVRMHRRSAAVVLCNPLSEEAMRAHRVYRVMANQLEGQGFAVLRFDYRCTGDSLGDESEARLENWIEDICTAAEEVVQRSGSSRVVLCGVRLGATMAALAAAEGHLRVRQLVLWDPVIDGAAHLRDLSIAHDSYLREELSTYRGKGLGMADGPDEYLGQPLSKDLLAAIASIDLARTEVFADKIDVIRTLPTPEQQRLEAAWQGRHSVAFINSSAEDGWNSDAGLNSVTVPISVVRTIINCIEEHNP